MAFDEYITFVVPVNDQGVYEKNFLASPIFSQSYGHKILDQRNFQSAAKAYNNAINKTANDLMVFVHQDVWLPENWLNDLKSALKLLEDKDPLWGVIGCYGATRNNESFGHLYSSGLGRVLGASFKNPKPVQTLDEVVLILRKSSGLRFDESLPHFHLYGTDICMAAANKRLNCYAISAFCIHNSNPHMFLPNEFYQCCEYVRKKWRNSLPIQSPCERISRFNIELYLRRLKEVCQLIFKTNLKERTRVEDPQKLFNMIKREVIDTI